MDTEQDQQNTEKPTAQTSHQSTSQSSDADPIALSSKATVVDERSAAEGQPMKPREIPLGNDPAKLDLSELAWDNPVFRSMIEDLMKMPKIEEILGTLIGYSPCKEPSFANSPEYKEMLLLIKKVSSKVAWANGLTGISRGKTLRMACALKSRIPIMDPMKLASKSSEFS